MRKYFWPVVIAILALLVLFGGAMVGLYVDWLWFSDLGFGVVFTTILLTRIKVGLLFGVLFFAIIYSNLWYARRIAPPPSPMGIEQQLIERLGALARRGIGLLLLAGSVVLAAMVGLEAATHWEEWLKYFNATPFNATDPVFHKDIGFYVFQLPFLNYLYHWLFFAIAVAAIATGGIHYAGEAIEYFGNRLQFAPKAKTHLAVLVALLFLLKAWGYRLTMYGLLSGQGKLFDGAGYADVHARIPALWIMLVIAIVGGLLVLANINRRGIAYAIAGLVLLVGASLVVGSGYPAFMQKFSVAPNELEKETPYIRRAINMTRDAFGLTNVAARQFAAETALTPQQIEANSTTIENIRLWDQGHLLDAYAQIQTIQQYYEFTDVDVDRYWLHDREGGEKRYRQVWLSARELSQTSLPAKTQTWFNKHLQYTHGYGFVMSPVNAVSAEGLPQLFIYDIPPKTTVDTPVKRMGVYFGDLTDAYVFVKTGAREFDYPTAGKEKSTEYQANVGVGVGSFFRKLILSLRFGDVNIMLNQDLRSDSKILFRREIRDRVERLMPFLRFDNDPYLVTVNGNLYWIRDGYTLTDGYPYSQHLGDLGAQFNYIRNSVKVVIDAYTGEVHAYAIQKPLRDPLIETYSKVFPGMFKPISEMPRELAEHIRYPEDLFRIQTAVYCTYHMSDPTKFYNSSDLWEIPTRAVLSSAQEAGEAQQMEPYYVIMKLPNGAAEEFILMTPYIRAGKKNMVAWMCARCDAADYGRLVLYDFPQYKNVFGPQQIATRVNQDPVISQQITLWNTEGSRVGTGNLLVIPIEKSLLYVMPVYLVSTTTKIPELKRVIVALGDRIAMEPTLEEALSKVVGGPVEAPPSAAARPPRVPGVPAGAVRADLTPLVDQALSQYDAAEQAQRKGDWAEYGKQINALKATLKELQSKAR